MFRALNRRRTQDQSPASSPTADDGPGLRSTATEEARTGKGRPTPKRRDAERERRARVSVPKDPRAARQRARQERSKARQAMLKGDERHLPRRDAGPLRRFARDYVDARRCAAEFFLPGALVVLLLSLSPSVAVKNFSLLIWLVMILIIVVDSFLVVRGLSRAARERFPEENRKGMGRYALARSMQFRRLRLPPPQVKPGDSV